MLVGGIPNPFFGRVILAFEELMGYYFRTIGESDTVEIK